MQTNAALIPAQEVTAPPTTTYAAEEFEVFGKTANIEHVTSPPLYSQSNGFIERTVPTVKSILKKARQCADSHS